MVNRCPVLYDEPMLADPRAHRETEWRHRKTAREKAAVEKSGLAGLGVLIQPEPVRFSQHVYS